MKLGHRGQFDQRSEAPEAGMHSLRKMKAAKRKARKRGKGKAAEAGKGS